MPKININHKSSVPAPEAMIKIKDFFNGDNDIRKLDPKMKTTFDDGSMSGQLKGSQFKADIQVKSDGPGSQVSVIIDLPLILTPLKGKVEETIKKTLGKFLV